VHKKKKKRGKETFPAQVRLAKPEEEKKNRFAQLPHAPKGGGGKKGKTKSTRKND